MVTRVTDADDIDADWWREEERQAVLDRIEQRVIDEAEDGYHGRVTGTTSDNP